MPFSSRSNHERSHETAGAAESQRALSQLPASPPRARARRVTRPAGSQRLAPASGRDRAAGAGLLAAGNRRRHVAAEGCARTQAGAVLLSARQHARAARSRASNLPRWRHGSAAPASRSSASRATASPRTRSSAQQMELPFVLLSDADSLVCNAVRCDPRKEHVRTQGHGDRAQYLSARRRGRAQASNGASSRSTATRSRSSKRRRRCESCRAPTVRARHERTDARSDRDLSLRRARHLSADGGARRAGCEQEGAVGGVAQCAPGQPLSRRHDARGHQGADRRRSGHPVRL